MINGVTDDDSREAVFGRLLEVLNRLDQAKVWCRAYLDNGRNPAELAPQPADSPVTGMKRDGDRPGRAACCRSLSL